MLHDAVVTLAVLTVLGLFIYLLKFPIERGLRFRGEPELRVRTIKKQAKPKTPFQSLKSSPQKGSTPSERKCGKCGQPESEHGLTLKHSQHHVFVRRD